MGGDNQSMSQSECITTMPTVVWRPNDIENAWETHNRLDTESKLIAGGTLIQLKREQGTPLPPNLISLEQIEEMQGIHTFVGSDIELRIGALTTMADIQTDALLTQKWQLLSEAVKQIASPAVRNRATIGGNIEYGVGDILPALLAINADVLWFDGKNQQQTRLADYLNKGGVRSILTAVVLPKQPVASRSISFYKKVGRREAFIPSLVTVSVSGGLGRDNEIEFIRIAIGGGTYPPQRLKACEQLLNGAILTEELLASVYENIIETFNPQMDEFASTSYRKSVAANLIISELDKYIKS